MYDSPSIRAWSGIPLPISALEPGVLRRLGQTPLLLVTLLGLFVALAPGAQAWAEDSSEDSDESERRDWGCQKDTDCKGDRICNKGECVSPEPPTQPSPVAPNPAPDSTREQLPDPSLQSTAKQGSRSAAARAHYAERVHSGAITGIVGSVMTLSFGLVAAATDNYWVALGAGSGALLSTAITVPVAGGPAGQGTTSDRGESSYAPQGSPLRAGSLMASQSLMERF